MSDPRLRRVSVPVRLPAWLAERLEGFDKAETIEKALIHTYGWRIEK